MQHYLCNNKGNKNDLHKARKNLDLPFSSPIANQDASRKYSPHKSDMQSATYRLYNMSYYLDGFEGPCMQPYLCNSEEVGY